MSAPVGHAGPPRPRWRSLPVLVAVSVGLAGLAAAIVVAASTRSVHGPASNRVATPVFAQVLAPGQRLCQGGEDVPAGTASVGVHAQAQGVAGPPLRAAVRGSAGGAAGRAPGGWRSGYVAVPVGPVRRELLPGSVCIVNLGAAPIRLAGDGRLVRFDYLTAGPQSWWSFLPELQARFSRGKSSWYGAWALPVVLLLIAATAAATVRALVRQLP